VRERSSQFIGLAFVLAFAASVGCVGLGVSAQNTKSSTTNATTSTSTTKHQPRRPKSKRPWSGRCDPTKQEQADLSGTYTGKVNYPDASLTGDATLTITGNDFSLTAGSTTQSGRITAVTTCNYTGATMMFGDLTPPPPSPNPPPPVPAVSLRVRKMGDRVTLMTVPGERRSFSFGTAGSAKAKPRRRRGKIDGGMKAANEAPQFPWPPPRASASVRIPDEFVRKPSGETYLRDVSERLTQALNRAGYEEISWYAVPDGFALVSQFEQCDSDGTPLSGATRFLDKVFRPPLRTPWDYIRKLILPEVGHFRVIVIIVSDHPFSQRNVRVSRDEALAWLSSGTNGLPQDTGDLRFTNAYLTTALIYEFEQASVDSGAILKQPSSLTGKMHLQKCGIWAALERR